MAKKIVTYEEDVCDVCGKKADGEYYTIEYLNGDIRSETSCPLDLCKNHMSIFARKYSHLEYERGAGGFEGYRANLLKCLKEDKSGYPANQG